MLLTEEIRKQGHFTKNNTFRYKNKTWYNDKCYQCGIDFWKDNKKNKFCSNECYTESRKNIKRPNHSKRMSGKNNPFYGKKHSKESKEKMSKTTKKMMEKKNDHPRWKGGYRSGNVPFYDTYAPQLEWCEKVRRSPKDGNILEVKCFEHNCKRWFVPKRSQVNNRIQSINGNYRGEHHFYCSYKCKQNCIIYGKNPDVLQKDIERRNDYTWIKMVKERDNYTCRKCGKKNKIMFAHHIKPVKLEPIESMDIDNGITLCEFCHKEVHNNGFCNTGFLAHLIC